MKTRSLPRAGLPGLIPLAALGAAFAFGGCVKEQSYQTSEQIYQPPGRVPLAPVVAEDDYDYYPDYEVYYSTQRHLYGYWESGAWYWRPDPPHVTVKVLYASPSVRLDFHDSPERHHSTVVKRYPRNWKPSSPPHDDKDHDKPKQDDHRH